MAAFLPPVGSKGVMTLSAPFQNAVAANVPYKVAAIRSLADISAAGDDPYELYYQPYQISDADYASDVNAGAYIISLQSSSGAWVYVPSTYLAAAPNVVGFPYTNMVVGVNLGALPDSLSLTYFMAQIQVLAHDLLGVTDAPVAASAVSPTTNISKEDRDAFENARALIMGEVVTDYAKLRVANAALLSAQQKIAELEAYIRSTATVSDGNTTSPPTSP